MPKIVVLTGGIGSGKSTVSGIFKSLKVKIIDTDIISKKLTGKNGAAIRILKDNFDNKFFNLDGSLNKEKIRYEIFSDIEKKIKIEKILHPMISKEVEIETRTAKSPYVIHVVPLWVEKNKNSKSTIWKLIVVDCYEKIQKQRAISRSKIDADTFDQIKNNQVTRQTRLDAADYIIDNNGVVSSLKTQVARIHKYLINNL